MPTQRNVATAILEQLAARGVHYACGLVPEGTSLYNPDFAGYAVDCGGLGLKAGDSAELEAALREAIKSNRPSLVDVHTSGLAVPGTKLPS